jgi:hypothetical protein
MIIEESKSKATFQGMGETTEFSLNLDGMMFDSLMNGIYSDKIAAPIRELSTNARDGHVRRGNLDRPFDIKLPTRLDQEFSVRDYGSSLTHEEIMNMYTVLGQSTKRSTNDETGCLGLGSKSPFAYTSAFTVTCWLDGIERTYSAYITTSGIPNMSLVHKAKSSEEQGVKVAFAVKDDDIQKFHKSAETVLLGFDPVPNIHPSSFNLASREITIKGTGWKFCKERINAVIIQGSVSYPIDRENVALQSALSKELKFPTTSSRATHYQSYLQQQYGMSILESSIIINVPIGSLDVVTSRESLQYTDRTIKSIVDILKNMKNEVKSLIEIKLDKAKHYRAACSLLVEIRNDNSPIGSFISNRVFNEEDFDYKKRCISQKLPIYDYDCMIMEAGTQNLKTSYKRDMKNSRRYSTDKRSAFDTILWGNLEDTPPSLKNGWKTGKYTIVVQSNEQEYSINKRMRTFWENSEHNGGYLWVITETDIEAEEIQDKFNLNDNEIFLLHKLEDTSMPSRVSVSGIKNTDIKLRVMKPLIEQYYYKKMVNTEIVDVEDDFIYIRQEGQNFFLDKTDNESYNEENMMRLLKRLSSTLPKMSTIYTIPKSRKKLMEKSKSISLNDYVKKKMTRNYIKGVLKDIPISVTTYDNKTLEAYLKETKIKLPKILEEFCKRVSKNEVTTKQIKIKNNLNFMISKFKPDLLDFLQTTIDKKFNLIKIENVSTPILLSLSKNYTWKANGTESVNALNEYIKLKGYK